MTGSAEAATLGGDESLELQEFDRPPSDPIALMQEWIAAATARRVREPNALVLATTDAQGRPASRVVLLKHCDSEGLLFTTHRLSTKGRHLDAFAHAAATLYWRETLQQLNVSGPVVPIEDVEADALFAARPRDAQATTSASRQSEPLRDEEEIQARAARLMEGTIVRPADWGGYRLKPSRIEFWHGRSNRLHRRLEYLRVGSEWSSRRLQP